MAKKQAKKRTSSSAKAAEITAFEVAVGIYLFKRLEKDYKYTECCKMIDIEKIPAVAVLLGISWH